MMTTLAAEYDHMELQQQYGSSDTVNNRWDDDWDNENSSARLFERSRIKALAGRNLLLLLKVGEQLPHGGHLVRARLTACGRSSRDLSQLQRFTPMRF